MDGRALLSRPFAFLWPTFAYSTERDPEPIRDPNSAHGAESDQLPRPLHRDGRRTKDSGVARARRYAPRLGGERIYGRVHDYEPLLWVARRSVSAQRAHRGGRHRVVSRDGALRVCRGTP